jgi:N6-adenosine-specific RNA methylase IME4
MSVAHEGSSEHTAASSLRRLGSAQFGTILADPPWRFANSTGKVIEGLPVAELALPESHLYLWVPNALIVQGLEVMRRWGFTYKTNIVWYKVRKDGGPDRRGVGFYFRNVTELVLFGVRGGLRTGPPGRRQPNILISRKREHSRKPDEFYGIIERCSPGPYLELFARHSRPGWVQWGDEIEQGRSVAEQIPAREDLGPITPSLPLSYPVP